RELRERRGDHVSRCVPWRGNRSIDQRSLPGFPGSTPGQPGLLQTTKRTNVQILRRCLLLHRALVFLEIGPLLLVDLAVLVRIRGVEVRQQAWFQNGFLLVEESVLVRVEPR